MLCFTSNCTIMKFEELIFKIEGNLSDSPRRHLSTINYCIALFLILKEECVPDHNFFI